MAWRCGVGRTSYLRTAISAKLHGMHEDDPIERFRAAYAQALESEIFDAARAALATAGADGAPSVRFVLVKEFDARGFVFYTHAHSQKGREIAENPRAALSFHWSSTGEQVRVCGAVTEVEPAQADRYFASRPRGSQLGAWASLVQSAPIASRDELSAALRAAEARFGDGPIARPPHWSGYCVAPERIEFWPDRRDRLHERTLYVHGAAGWTRTILSP
jgi:pyridoxamine 5'-phosphate oxidase